MKRFLFLLLLLGMTHPCVRAQQLTMRELIDITCMTPAQLDSCLFRKGFVFKKRSESVVNAACIYAYPTIPGLTDLSDAAALVEYICNKQVGILVFQQRSKKHQAALRHELIRMGFRPVDGERTEFTERQIFYKGNIVVSFKPTDPSNGIAGNYTGYNVSIHHNRPM